MRKQQLGRESAIQLRSVQLDKERIVSHAICPVDHWLARDMPKMNPPAANTAEKAFANSGYAYLRYSPLRNCRRKTLIENAWRTQRGFFNYDRCRRQKTVRRLWKKARRSLHSYSAQVCPTHESDDGHCPVASTSKNVSKLTRVDSTMRRNKGIIWSY